jgi:glucan phosphoethanolaminetransferase (alkaline phosphatase superfamily)
MTVAQVIGILLIILAVAIGVLLIIFRKTLVVKIVWRYVVILIPAILVIAAVLLSKKKVTTTGSPQSKTPDLNKALSDVKTQLEEANMTTAIEVTATEQQNKDKLDQLKKITDIEDDDERRKQLAALLG